MLGGVPVVVPNSNALTPSQSDCVEVGPVRIIGGVRPQNFDVGYRPDGVRFAFDSKTLNDAKSVGKNWQNMVNDLATEATTVHSRFPHAVVAFLVAIPEPCLPEPQRSAMIETPERQTAVSTPAFPPRTLCSAWSNSHVRSRTPYVSRYKGLPPHAA